MNPESIARILALPEGRELVVWLQRELFELNSLDNIPQSAVWEVALETKARQRASQKLKKILGEFTSSDTQKLMGIDKEEFIV